MPATSDVITWLYVAPDQCRKGIARQLLQHALARCDRVVTLEVLEGGEPALSLYYLAGFRLAGPMEGRLVGNEVFPAIGLQLRYDRNEKRDWHAFNS